jgi:hypothetical protein
MNITTWTITLILAGSSTHASIACDDLWLARNAIFDLHGYCFGSTLGKSIFDNNGCSSVDPELAPELKKRVQLLWHRAKQLSCDTDQWRTSILIYNIEQRKTLLHQPVASETESACIGYTGLPFRLYDAPNGDANNIGSVEQGDDIGWFHDDEKNWSFMTVLDKENGSTPISGWSREQAFPNCEVAAG